MSFVTTPRRSSVDSARQTVAIRELLPVPTGPATPRRNDRVSGMEETHPFDVVLLGEDVDAGSGVGRDGFGGGQVAYPLGEVLDVRVQAGQPDGGVTGIDREQLQRSGDDGLGVLVPHEPGGLGSAEAGDRADDADDQRSG